MSPKSFLLTAGVADRITLESARTSTPGGRSPASIGDGLTWCRVR